MAKKKFYIYQEDLIKYRFANNNVIISQLVMDLNEKFCQEGMRKLRTEIVTNYLIDNGYLIDDGTGKKRPTFKGEILGIKVGHIIDKKGQEIEVNLYNERAQNFILDNLYEMM